MDIAATLYQPDACSDSTLLIATTATEIYKAYRDSLLGAFNEAYTSKCLNAGAIESFTLNRPVSEYHYTLYYYDQAGNLIKTISPEGVHPNRDDTWLAEIKTKRAAGEVQTPEHTLPVMYRYNSLNQVVTQNSPDGGYSYFFYDRLGRLVVSQNAKQKAADNYSYTRYDYLGRITEVGEKSQSTVMTNSTSRSQSSLQSWLNYTYTLNSQTVLARQVTRTVYDLPATLPLVEGTTAYSFHQKSYTMRNRVSNTLFYDVLLPGSPDPVYSDYASGSYYSYDIHGNVDTLLQDYRTGLMATGNGKNRFKLTAYNYDLISGKVNQVHFQPGEKDQFYHRYEYDAENRITGVFTTDVKEFVGTGNNEDHEASYEYYKHGPLARTVLGQQQVQGIDYAYTLQGWLKGVNSTSLMPDRDMGGDDGSFIARDVYGFNLNYFRGDYNPINHEREAFPDHTTYMAAHTVNSLYNGNISSMAVNISKFAPQLYNYKYDQLNRIVSMDVYRGLNQTQNKWNSLALTTNYKERVSYDPNGNILTYERNGTTAGGQPLTMDKLTYNYFTDGTNKRNNRLRMVRDDVASTNYTEDIDDQLGAVNNEADSNYVYDEIGNLIQDKSEKITGITWNVYGKILEITKTATDQNPVTKISYTYDAAGNRISKKTEKGATSETTWYVRDAQGNVLGVYTDKNTLTLTEHHLYGSSRLGIVNRDIVVSDPTITGTSLNLLGTSYLTNFERGKKFFELSNHLGNVLVTISDRKLQITNSSNGSEENGGCEIGSADDVLNVNARNGEASYTARNEINLLPGFTSTNGEAYAAYTDNSLTACVPYTAPSIPAQGWYYAADIVSANDYYPFGMMMPGRKFSSGSYRYGFNGKENDNDVKGDGNQQDYGMRISDPRLGKFLSVDPLSKKYPWNSAYAFAENSPMAFIDLDGAEKMSRIKNMAYDGSGWDYVRALENGVRNVINVVPDTWNSGVANVQSLQRGTWTADITGDIKQIGSGAKNFASYYWAHPKQFLSDAVSPEAVEGYATMGFLFVTGNPTGTANNLLSLETKVSTAMKIVPKVDIVSSRMAVAKNFLLKSGVTDIERHMAAIHFENAVSTQTLETGTTLYRYTEIGTTAPKHYFFTEPETMPGEIGKSSMYKDPSKYVLERFTLEKSVKVLKNTTDLGGTVGAQQVFSTEVEKAATVEQGSWSEGKFIKNK